MNELGVQDKVWGEGVKVRQFSPSDKGLTVKEFSQVKNKENPSLKRTKTPLQEASFGKTCSRYVTLFISRKKGTV